MRKFSMSQFLSWKDALGRSASRLLPSYLGEQKPAAAKALLRSLLFLALVSVIVVPFLGKLAGVTLVVFYALAVTWLGICKVKSLSEADSAITILSVFIGFAALWSWIYDQHSKAVEAGIYYNTSVKMDQEENDLANALHYARLAYEKLPVMNGFLPSTPKSEDVRHQLAYLEGMSSLRTILNLDRALTKAEMELAKRALGDADVLQQVEPDSFRPYLLKAQIYVATHRYDLALTNITMASTAYKQRSKGRSAETNPMLSVRRAMIEMYRPGGNLETATNILAEAGTNNKWAHLWWGIYYKDFVTHTDHSLDLAERSFKEALKLDDQFDLAWVNLGLVAQVRKNYPAAKRLYREALERTPRMKEALMEMGFIYGQLDHYRTAIAYLDDALDEDPSYRSAYERRAMVYESLGKTEKSTRHYEASERDWTSAIHLSPNNPFAYARRARLYRLWSELDPSRRDDAKKDIASAVDVYCDGMDLPGTGDMTARMKTAIKNVDRLPLDRVTRTQMIQTGEGIMKELEALALK